MILRTSWLYGRAGKNFVKAILDKAVQEPELRVVNDQVGCPTYAKDLADAIAAVIRMEAYGLYHAAGQGACSWFEFAEEILRLAGIPKKVIAMSSVNLNRPARRPAYSVLSHEKLQRLGMTLRPWREALHDYICLH